MSLTLSPAVKIFALLAVLATLVLAGGMTLLGPSADDTALDEPLVLPKKKAAIATAPKAAEKTAAGATARAKKLAPAAAKPKPAAKPAAKPKPKPAVSASGVPTAIVSALAANPVVVVSLFDDAAKVDPMAHDEAQAGAKLANAGFVAIDVTRDQKAAEALMLKLGAVLRAPMVVVFVRPGEAALTLDGFRDRDTVAQAAMNALR